MTIYTGRNEPRDMSYSVTNRPWLHCNRVWLMLPSFRQWSVEAGDFGEKNTTAGLSADAFTMLTTSADENKLYNDNGT